ncbi:hypothetical protein [Candidatus Leptofilum sp.]|uniref:hypothetical protein n=1 Tax=Candidatus Leptofilum sp. TaxID=3241576 RepID=UPI003B5C538A
MQFRQEADRITGWLAIGIAGAIVITIAFLILFFTIGTPYGKASDISIVPAAFLSAVLASRLYAINRRRLSQSVALNSIVLAWAGAIGVSIGSFLVVSGNTGYFLSGLVSALGWAFVGVWLFLACMARLRPIAETSALRRYGLLTGLTMMVGFVALPGILAQSDLPSRASILDNIAVSSNGFTYLLLLIWGLWVGRRVFRAGS